MTPKEIRDFVDRPLYHTIREVAAGMDTRAYIVGGFVRDLLLDRPSKDIDIVVEGSGIDFAHALSDKLKGTQVSFFKRFGTAMFKHDDVEYEIVGARKESYRYDSRKPAVEDASIEQDRERRDFTINALSIGLNADDFGAIIDPFGGLKDLEEGRLITPLDPVKTYSDDPLRMMRAIRFAAQLGFQIEEQSLAAISSQKERIQIVSQERITSELNKIIETKRPSLGFKLLFKTGLLHYVFPKMVELQGAEIKEGVGHKDNFFHTLQVLDNVADRSDDLWLRWSAILHDIAKPDTKRFDAEHGWTFHGHEDLGAKMTPRIFRSLKLPLDHRMKFVQKMVRLHLRPIALSKDTVSNSGIRRLLFDADEDLDALMILCESDITSKNEYKVQRFLQNFQRVREKCKEVEESDRIKNWQPPIGGKEIMDTFGLRPGREVGVIKSAIREAILEGEIKNEYEAARAYMMKKAKDLGLAEAKTSKQ
ncbi:MAG: HD domain-containing protein [Flavobacteriales bacterium]|nr:HD domain-containing protein [Flavobacteriales bacterium]